MGRRLLEAPRASPVCRHAKPRLLTSGMVREHIFTVSRTPHPQQQPEESQRWIWNVLYQGRGTHPTGMERELSGTDRKCAWWPSKTHICRVTERPGVREHSREGTRVPETGSYLDRG